MFTKSPFALFPSLCPLVHVPVVEATEVRVLTLPLTAKLREQHPQACAALGKPSGLAAPDTGRTWRAQPGADMSLHLTQP